MQKRALLRAGAALLLATSFIGSSVAAAAPDTVWRVATEGTFPPFEFYQDGQLTGFELDLVKAMGKAAGAEVHISSYAFDAIVPAMMAGTVDIGAAGFSITPERAKRVNFTTPFYESGLTIVVPKGSAVKDFSDLKGKRLSVQLGTTSHQYAKKIEGAQITTFNSAGDAILNMLAGQADAVINDKPVTDYILSQNASIAAKAVHLSPVASADKFAMVVVKSKPELLAAMNAAYKKVVESGEYAALYRKWFGCDPS